MQILPDPCPKFFQEIVMRNHIRLPLTLSLPRSALTASALLLAAVAGVFAPGPRGWQPAQAAATDIATLPVFSSTPPAVEVKPNVMFILDDSGSMQWTHMPDQVVKFAGRYGFASSHCNGIYYNPTTTYTPPVYADGTSYPNQSYTAAARNGYDSTSGTIDLSVSFRAAVNSEVFNAGYLGGTNITSDATEEAYYYVYSGTQTAEKLKNYYDTNSVFYKECSSTIGDTTAHDGTNPVNKVFKKERPTTAAEKTNFANWYSYYRNRMIMMKTATGLAFKSLDDKFRVGFMTLNSNTTTSFLNIGDFTTTQKNSFYTSLYGSSPGSGTPLRVALSAAGRMYAGKLSSYDGFTVTDPVQFSCQQNYTLLSTDGMWNGGNGVRLDGSTDIGNQDGALARPYNDGSQVTTTTVTSYFSNQDRTTNYSAGTQTRTWTRSTTTIGAACSTTNPPSNTASAPMNVGNSRTGALYQRSSDPDGGQDRCEQIESGVWFCRTGGSAGLPSGGQASATGSGAGAKTWYLVSDISGQSGCRSARNVFGSGYSTSSGICPAVSVTGNSVTVTPYTLTESMSTYTSSTVDRWTAVQTTTQTTVNGVPGAVGPLTPATPSYTKGANQSFNETAGTRTCGGVAVAFPTSCEASGVGTWVAGTPSPNNVCVATASLPTAGTSSAVLAGTVSTGSSTTTPAPVQIDTQVVTNPLPGTTDPNPTVSSVGAGGVADTLADVAAYYYSTDLRTADLGNCTGPTIAPSTTANDLCTNNVPASGVDTATSQHMTTFTLGLGVRGRMVFSPTYLTDTSGDFWDVLKGNTATSSNCTWRDTLTVAGGACNWPVPGADKVENTDDLWHTAVNGRGNYFSATDPASLAAGLTSTLKAIINTPKPGTASAAATTNPKITSTNNFQFSSYFKTVEWSGELIRQTMNLTDGSVPYYDPFNPDATTYDWSARTLLDAKDYTTRKLYTQGSGSRIDFTWAALGTAGLTGYFTGAHISTTPPAYPTELTGLSQFCATGANCISATAQSNTTVATGGAAGEALVNFLRGDRSNEEGVTADNTKFFRYRKHVLGDIVSAQPQYVGAPTRYYSDAGYADFKTAQASRTPIVYTAANDGMLHAFNAATGQEEWAYIPGLVLPRLYTLADKAYGEKHQYFVEGTPTTGDICSKAPTLNCSGSEWQTILVGGLNGGGTGYYALDITNPANPTLLWEFTHPAMGYSFGKPQITKLSDGTWVVLLTSGYNNCPRTTAADQLKCVKDGTGDGVGYLYVLNAATGAQITGSPISTAVGSNTLPSGLAQIAAQADSNNVSRRVYGGDLLGNVWRFNIEAGNFGVHQLAILKDSAGAVQPVTVRPQVTTINGSPVVYLGTGRYLGTSDIGGTPKNSFYAIKDDLTTNPTYNNPRTYTSFIGQLATDGVCPSGTDVSICLPGQVVRLVSQVSGAANSNLTTQNGWFVDFPADVGEIEFTDPKLTLGTLAFSTSIPIAATSAACTANSGGSEGTAFGYMLDYLTGGTTGTTSGVIATNLGAGVATAPQIAQLPNGTVIAKYRLSTGQEVSVNLRFSAGGGATRRISWRELVSE
jgi:type IV pilus assembly protein PilY1